MSSSSALGDVALNAAELTSITSTLSEMLVQLVEVIAGAVDEMTESGDSASLDVEFLITSIDSDVFWECCNVSMDGDDVNGCCSIIEKNERFFMIM